MKLEGFAFTEAGWVQSYGSRYVRPPIIHGDVVRKGPMTIKEFEYAQSLTKLPVKGMLTGVPARCPHARQCRRTQCVREQLLLKTWPDWRMQW